MVGPKKQDFWPKINITSVPQTTADYRRLLRLVRFSAGQTLLKGNHCILRIRRAPVRQKLDMILENKVVQKLKLENSLIDILEMNFFLKFFFVEKIRTIFDIEN
jgi:hypothetical protein